MGNNAISANPPSYAIDITTRGSDFLWAVFCIMAVSGIAVSVLGFLARPGKRLFHWLSAALLFTASVAYFSMASNLGKAAVLVEFPRQRANLYTGPAADAYRSIWYARYIDWTITTPLLLLDLLLATGLPSADIFFTIFMDIVMIVTGLIGALVPSRYKFGFFTFGCVAMFFVFATLIGPARKSAYAVGPDAGSSYVKSAVILAFLWTLYPICWGIADGGNVIPPDSEMVFYGVLDVLAKPCFVFFHLFSLRNIAYERFELQSGHFSIGATDLRNDIPFTKMNGASNGHANGNANGETSAIGGPVGHAPGVQHSGAH